MTKSLKADGVEIDAYAHGIGVDSNRWSVPGAKGENVLVPARHGSLYVADKTFMEGEFSLGLIVEGARPDGSVPIDQLAQTRENIDRLLRIFTKRKKLIHFEQEQDDGSVIECHAECIGAFDVTRSSSALPYAKMTVGFKIPAAFWRDQAPREFVSPAGTANQVLRLPPFEGGTAPMDDGLYLVQGPITNPELYVYATGAYTRLHGTVPIGSAWRVDASNWTSVMGPGVTFENNGPSVIRDTVHGGSGSLMDLPPLAVGDFALEVNGVNTGAATRVSVRGRRKYLVSH